MRLLAKIKPDAKDKFIAAWLRGDKSIDITQDEDLFYQVNKDRVTLEKFVDRDKFKEDAEAMKIHKAYLNDPKYGKTKGGKMRWLGDIPAEIYFSRKEFSDPAIPKEERWKALKNFFNSFPVFRAGDKPL